MASPQKENGYTAIANEIMDRLVQPGISGSEYRLLIFVIRKTYGFNKISDKISLSQFQKATLMGRSHVIETIKSLVHKRVLGKEKNLYKFNKNWEQWIVHKRVPSTQLPTGGSTQKGSKSSTQLPTYKRHKDNITKDIAPGPGAEKQPPQFKALGAEIIKAFEAVDVKNKTYYNNTTQRKACDFLIDQYGLEECLKRIGVLPKTNKVPYFPKINSPNELKEKWVKLEDAVHARREEVKKITKSTPNYIL